MTAAEAARFDEACRLVEVAGVLILHRYGWEASWYLDRAAEYAATAEGQVALLDRAQRLRAGVLERAARRVS